MDKENTPVDNSNNVSNIETPNKDNSQDAENSTVERYKQQIEWSKQEAMHIKEVHSAYRQVLKDNSYLQELDPNIAKDVVAQLYDDWYSDTNSYEELLEWLNWSNENDNSNSQIDEKDLEKRIRESILVEQNESKANEILETSLKEFDNDVKTEFLKEFKETIGKKKLTPKLAQKEIDKIILYHNKDKMFKTRSDEALVNLASNGLNNSKSSSKSTKMTKSTMEWLGIPADKQKALYPELFTK